MEKNKLGRTTRVQRNILPTPFRLILMLSERKSYRLRPIPKYDVTMAKKAKLSAMRPSHLL